MRTICRLCIGLLVAQASVLVAQAGVLVAQASVLVAQASPPAKVASHQQPARDWFEDLDDWFAAVDRHVPGLADEAAASIAPWTADRLTLTLADVVSLRKQMAVYQQRPKAEIRLRARRIQPTDVEALCRITAEERLAADLNRVIRRGAVLHADIARFARDLPMPGSGADILVRMSDGRQASVDPGTGHWRFGRELLSWLQPDSTSSRFTAAWYLATAAHMQAERMMTLADQHLSQARRVVADDTDILFESACALESLASRRVQSEMESVSLPPGYTLELRPVRTMEDEAAALFRSVLARDPNRCEARVRLARLVGARGGHAEAAADLRRALGAPVHDALAYFAWLFLGDEELALGHRESASEAYERAAALFPNAASPVVALARLAREYGDRKAVAEALHRWWALPSTGLDPWLEYYLLQGGDVETRMHDLYALAGGGRQ